MYSLNKGWEEAGVRTVVGQAIGMGGGLLPMPLCRKLAPLSTEIKNYTVCMNPCHRDAVNIFFL